MGTPLHVLPNVAPYLEAFSAGAREYARVHGTAPEEVALVAAICLRESWAGWAPGYRPQGSPDGSGDWIVRTGRWTKLGLGVIVHADSDGARAALIAAGWTLPKKRGAVVRGPYATPLDGKGWGRGLLQADAFGDVRDLIAPEPWPVDRQAAAACAMLARAREQLAPLAAGDLLELAVICRYNASLDRVRAGLEAGDPNIGTAGGDYGRDVLALRDAVRARWPEGAVA